MKQVAFPSIVKTLLVPTETPTGLLIATPPTPQLIASVIIPAKDEALRLRQTLQALASQIDLVGCPLDPRTYEIIVLANNCSDQTAQVARNFAQAHPQLTVHVVEIILPASEAHVGRARRLLMDEACLRLEHNHNSGSFLASTDADTCVAPTWLAAIQAELQAGNDAVGGRIFTNARREARCAVHHQHLRDATYRILRARLESLLDPDPADPWPRHHQHFGASLALTPVAYRRVGGLPVVPYLEDEALYQALRRHDLRVRHSPRVQVVTSDRQTGRVAVGLSWQLRQWAFLRQQNQEPSVECPRGLQQEWTARRQLRAIWQQHLTNPNPPTLVLRKLAATLGVPPRALAAELRLAKTFGALWHWVEHSRQMLGHWSLWWPPVPLGQALAEVRLLLRQHHQGLG